MAQGQRYVVNISYDDTSTVTTGVPILNGSFLPSGQTMSTIDLAGPGNSLGIFVPMEGLDVGTPFVYTQTQADHDTSFIPSPTLNFTDGSNVSDVSNIIGLEFEGSFFTGAGNNFIEIFNSTANAVSPIFQISQIINFGVDTAIIGYNALAPAVDLVATAGPNVVYSAGSLSGTATASNPTNNNLGAFRSDGEDFVNASWTESGNPLVGATSGNDITVAIENSGLATTDDTTDFSVTFTEDFTGKSDTDTVAVSYQNAPVTSADAGPALVYDAANLTRTADGSVVDPDLAVNALIPGFEAHTFEWKQGATTVGTTEDVALGIASSGLTHATSTATLDLTATDRAGTSQSASTGVSYVNAGPTADAGPNVVFDASNLTQTADGSVSDPDLAVNAQIAGFESHSFEWKLGAALLGSVEDLSLGIVASGLMTTTDTATLDFTATDFAGASDSDTTGVSYANALPTIATASATAMGDDLLFELDFDDLDLGVNTLIPGFEQLSVQILVDMIDSTALFGDLIANGSQLLDQATLLGTFGQGSHQFEARISDRVILASGGTIGPVTDGFQFEVAAAPEPATLGLLALGAAGLGGSLRRRRKAVRGGDGR